MKIRAFLAFDISKPLEKELEKLIALLAPKVGGIKWVSPDLMHCTLKFFGDIEEGLALGDVSRSIEQSLSNVQPAQLRCVGVGFFPNWRYPKVVWAGLAGDTAPIIKLHADLETRFEKFGFEPDRREFRMHLTLGRIKGALKNKDQFVHSVEKMADKEFGEFLVDGLTLYRSVLTKAGPVYTALREFPIGPRR